MNFLSNTPPIRSATSSSPLARGGFEDDRRLGLFGQGSGFVRAGVVHDDYRPARLAGEKGPAHGECRTNAGHIVPRRNDDGDSFGLIWYVVFLPSLT